MLVAMLCWIRSSRRWVLLLQAGLAAATLLSPAEAQEPDPPASPQQAAAIARPSVEIPQREGGTLRVEANVIRRNSDGSVTADGDVVATWRDATLRAERIEYFPGEGKLRLEGAFELVRGSTWLKGRRAEFDLGRETGLVEDAEGFTDEELFIKVRRLFKTGPRTYLAEDGWLTACTDRVPKWSFAIRKARIDLDGTARLSHTVFRVRQVPLLYFPYLILPTEKKERSSGFLLPSTGTSTTKGRRFTNRFYLVLGRSADLFLEQDYYTLRGVGGSFNLRARPNQETFIDIGGQFVDDRLGQGGGEVEGVVRTRLGREVRAVADFDLVSNFRFRQTFSDNFFTATRPTETSRFFLSNNVGSRSFNLLVAREETRTAGRNTVTQAMPAVEFRLLGQRLGKIPVYVDLDSSVTGASRTDNDIETPRISQRIDLFPRVYFSLPLFQGLRLTPTLGIRETFYSDSLLIDDQGRRTVSGDSLHREYVDFSLDLSGWGLAKVYGNAEGTRWKHVVEPFFEYRYRSGIDAFERTIRFDSQDPVADTHSLTYGFTNRIFSKRSGGRAVEWMSLTILQQHFLDPTFGGAVSGTGLQQFYPLTEYTGLPYLLGPRDFSPVSLIARLRPTGFGRIDWRADYDTVEGAWRNLSLTGSVGRDWWSAGAAYFVTRRLTEEIGRSHQLQGRAHLGRVGHGLSASGYFSYDMLSDRLLNRNVRLNYFWDCCGVSVEYWGFDIGTRQESQVRFSLYLKGIGAFGTIRRPEIVF
ncbi:MAG: hypothetical protein Kow00109_25910 [Acidobacteriota bacterium]